MSEIKFNPERRKFLKQAIKAGVATVLGVEAGRRFFKNNEEKKENQRDIQEGEIFDENELFPQSIFEEKENPLEEKEIFPFNIETNILEEEIFGKKRNKKSLLYQEWQRISQKERENLYQRRFSNQAIYLEKYFSPLLQNREYRRKVARAILSASTKYNVPAGLILGIIGVESGGHIDAVSPSKPEAKGILQLVPQVARDLGLRVDEEVDERLDVEKNIEAGVRYLAKLKEYFGSFGLALIAYCEGPTKFEDQLCRHYPQLKSQNSQFRRRDGRYWRKFTPEGYQRFLQMVRDKEITIVHLYSRRFKNLGVIHPFQYPFYVEAMSEQVKEIINCGKILVVPEIKKSEKVVLR